MLAQEQSERSQGGDRFPLRRVERALRGFLDPPHALHVRVLPDPDGALDQAQEDKLELVCRKLRLRPGRRSSTSAAAGAASSAWAAERHGVVARGVTLSAQQAEWAAANIPPPRPAGPRPRRPCSTTATCHAHLRFDKIAAVGVIEHVGIRNYPSYFARVHELLRPGGLFFNHGITHRKAHWKRSTQTGTSRAPRLPERPDGQREPTSST